MQRLSLMTRAAILAATTLTAACSGGGGGTSAVPSSTVAPAPAPAATSLVLSSASAAYLSLNLNALANYADPQLPAYYTGQVLANDNVTAANPVTNAGATLGRVLFNDKRLSVNGTIACASCHQQSAGFTDPNQFSVGFSGNVFGTFHAMRLSNVRYYGPGTMFWDKSAASIEAQATVPIQNPIEMGWDAANGGLTQLIANMTALPYYPELFKFAFGDPAITQTRIQDALAQFERSFISTGSRWDAAYAQVYAPNAPNQNLDVALPGFSAQENQGRHLFMAPPPAGAGCAACHVPPTFALSGNSLSNGLDAGETTVFKSPSLKNIAVTGPYMHDGRFSTLTQVIEHYNTGVLLGPALDPRLAPNGVPQRLNLSAADEAALVAFLNTLTDPAFLADPRFTSPFIK